MHNLQALESRLGSKNNGGDTDIRADMMAPNLNSSHKATYRRPINEVPDPPANLGQPSGNWECFALTNNEDVAASSRVGFGF